VQLSRYLYIGLSVLALNMALTGCSTTEEEPYVERSVEELYNEGRAYLNDGKYEKAATSFDEIDRQHPYSEWASQAQLMSSYAYYLAQKYEKALSGLESFIALHPSHQDVAYAYYLRGLCYYEQISTVQRDQKVTELALEAFRELIKKHPNTPYARDARIKIDLLRDHLAAREMDVGRYYQRKKAYPAAINRFKEVVMNYQTTSHVEEALHRLVELYLTINLPDEARKAAALLGHNFPGSQWYADSYALLQKAGVNADISKEAAASWLSTLALTKRSDRPEDNYRISDADLSADTQAGITRDLARPVERLSNLESYQKARKKVQEERSSIEKIEDWFSSDKPADDTVEQPVSTQDKPETTL
jgi:outer membrane protein assembly factor BamD